MSKNKKGEDREDSHTAEDDRLGDLTYLDECHDLSSQIRLTRSRVATFPILRMRSLICLSSSDCMDPLKGISVISSI